MPSATHQDFPGEKGDRIMSRPHSVQVQFQRDRLSYLWLALGILFFAFGTVRWTIPLAAWLYPVFLLRFLRTQPLLRGILLVLLATVVLGEFEMQGVVDISGALYYLIVFGMVVLYILPYLID